MWLVSVVTPGLLFTVFLLCELGNVGSSDEITDYIHKNEQVIFVYVIWSHGEVSMWPD